MDKRIAVFNKYWKESLPHDIESRTQRGKFVIEGWCVRYLFGEDCDGKFLDYYATHRMTNDRHVRIRSDGTRENLPALDTMRFHYEDPEEDARSERESIEKNNRILKMLKEKGFTFGS